MVDLQKTWPVMSTRASMRAMVEKSGKASKKASSKASTGKKATEAPKRKKTVKATEAPEMLSTPKKKKKKKKRACKPRLIPLPTDVSPCVVVTDEPDFDKIKELNKQYPKGSPDFEINRLSHKIQWCWQRKAGEAWTAEWRENAVRRLRSLADGYDYAARSYVHAPESERIHRPRLRALARILKATLDAHLLDNDTAREYLDTAENKARLFLDKQAGSKLTRFVGDVGKGPSAKRIIVEECDEIDHMLLRVHTELDNGAQRGNSSSWQTARTVAGWLVFDYYKIFIDRLKDPTKFELTIQTAENVAKKIEPVIDNLDTKEWPTLETAKDVVRAALRALGDKNAYDFFSNFDKKRKKHLAQKQDK